jgi:hypothetical protein
LLDPKSKKEIEEKIDTLLATERDFAENSPMPPPDLAEKGVYCTGDDCHQIRPKWERPIAQVTPPKSSIAAAWTVAGFGTGKSSGGSAAPIHFGDTRAAAPTVAERTEIEEKLAPKSPAKIVTKKSAGLKSAALKPAAKTSPNGSGKSGAAQRAAARKVRK